MQAASNTPNKYLVYYRVSTKGQGESGLGLEAQKAMIHHYLSPDQIAGEYVEVISAKVKPLDRPQLGQAIEQALANGYGLAVAKIDRLSRVTEDALQVFASLDGFLFSADIPMQVGGRMDKFTLTIFMAIADRERELISLRTKQALAALKAKQAKGESLVHENGTPKQPIGKPENLTDKARAKGRAKIAENARTNAAWVQAGEYAEMLREKGLTLRQIADRLNTRGYTTRRGKKYQATTVSRLLAKFAPA